MGKSFYRGTDSYSQKEVFLARERARKLKYVEWGNDESEQKQKEQREARETFVGLVKRLHSSSIRSIIFTGSIRSLDDEITHAMSRGTPYEEFPLLVQEEESHPIFTAHTQGIMEQVLRANPKLTDLYFSPQDDAPLLLEYDPEAGKKENLSEAQIEAIQVYVDALLKSLMPPRELAEIMEQALQITTQVRGNVVELQGKIEFLANVALAQLRYKKSGRKRSQA